MIGAKVVEPGLGKPSASPPLKPLRASRRHPNSCCGVIPCCRATSETTAPGCSLSSTMRALASGDQRRRRPTPVITSIRCKPSGAPSPRSVVGLSVLPMRCLRRGSHYRPCRTLPGRWEGITAYGALVGARRTRCQVHLASLQISETVEVLHRNQDNLPWLTLGLRRGGAQAHSCFVWM